MPGPRPDRRQFQQNPRRSSVCDEETGSNQMETKVNLTRYDKNSRRSRMVEAGGVLYFAGQVGEDWDADAKIQMQQALARIDALLAEAGSDKSKVLSVTIWLSDMADYDAVNEAWDAWVDPDHPPARACGKVEMADPRIRVELLPIAVK